MERREAVVPPRAAVSPSPAGGSLPEPGTVVAGYRLETLIGEGETGFFYEASKPGLQKRFALKLLDSRLGADPGYREHFEREGRIQTALEHPNLAPVVEVGESEHGLFVAAELIRAPTLRELIQNGQLGLDRTVRILGQVAGALDAVHRAGLLHGDIRPEAILVRAEDGDHAYLADFGVTADRRPTGASGAATTDYLAPERIRGEPPTMSTDVYALGAVLHECLLGTVPLPWEAPAQELPDDVLAVISTAMAKDPADRFATAEQLRRALALAIGDTVEEVAVPTTEPPVVEPRRAPAAPATTRPAAARRPRRRLSWAVAGIAVLALAAAGFLVGRAKSGASASSSSTFVADSIQFSVPSGWHRMTDVPRIPGLTLPGAVGIASKRDRGKLIAVHATGEWPTLLPAALTENLVSTSKLLDGREVVLLRNRQAFRYSDVALRSDPGNVEVFVVPDRGGVEMLSCVIPVGAASRLGKQCESMVVAAVLPTASQYSLLPQTDYAHAVNAVVDRLNSARDRAAKDLATAGSAAAQAKAARAAAQAYGREEQTLSKQQTDLLVAPVNRDIVAQMAKVRGAYTDLASAALRKEPKSFDEAKQVVREREAALKQLFGRLSLVGITVR